MVLRVAALGRTHSWSRRRCWGAGQCRDEGSEMVELVQEETVSGQLSATKRQLSGTMGALTGTAGVLSGTL